MSGGMAIEIEWFVILYAVALSEINRKTERGVL